MAVDDTQRAFRDALGTFATGVTIVTAVDRQGRPFGMTANSFTSVSLDPPLVLWNVGRDSWCYEDFCRAGHFAIHILGESQQALSQHFATKNPDKFSSVAWHAGPHDLPILDEHLTLLICRTEQAIDGGDHKILIARVEQHSRGEAADPLIFCRGRYRTLAD